MKSSIAAKIFGLAIVLVTIMIALVTFLLGQVRMLNRTIHHFAQAYQPLDSALVGLNEAGLRRRLAFERSLQAMLAGPGRERALTEATANYAKFSALITQRTEEAKRLLDSTAVDDEFIRPFERIRANLQQIENIYHINNGHQKEVLELFRSGESAKALPQLIVMDELQVNLQDLRHDTQQTMRDVIQAATARSASQHTRVLWLSVAATLVSVALGLSLAALITARLVRPVRSLVTGIRQVKEGDLTVELPVQSSDEVGAVTQAFNYFVSELRSKEELRDTFGKYVDPRVLARIIRDPSFQDTGPDRQEMTVSFSDLVGFTEIGEHLTPTNVVNVINRHFTLQAGAIQTHEGVIDKFIGDAVMAFWGPPFTDASASALLACRSALQSLRAVEELSSELPDLTGLRRNPPRVDIRLGISTGAVVVGNIGSKTTRSYTVMGDTVNVASRLEQLNRLYGTHILLCETTLARVGEDAIIVREIDSVVAKGKSEPTRIFELLGLADSTDKTLLPLVEHFTSGLAAFRRRDWDAAEAAFEQCLALRPSDGPAQLFLQRITTFREDPPAADWDGSCRMLTK